MLKPRSSLAALLLLSATLAYPAAAQPTGQTFTDQIDALFAAWDPPTSPRPALAVLH
ncbi:MAG: hypothetical protein IH820_12335, partial [Bacteroidetes bacterium]|nr:hypothetical protein [Bacteroidota bacterium]